MTPLTGRSTRSHTAGCHPSLTLETWTLPAPRFSAGKVAALVPEAPLERVETGVRPAGEGWFVVNARELPWFESDGCGFYASFEPESARFDQVGIGIGILRPGEPNAMYHGEGAQEEFLVISGEWLPQAEGEARRIRDLVVVHGDP